jgi:hypothetical protein
MENARKSIIKKKKGDQGRELQTEIAVLLISPEKFGGIAGWKPSARPLFLVTFMSFKHTHNSNYLTLE